MVARRKCPLLLGRPTARKGKAGASGSGEAERSRCGAERRGEVRWERGAEASPGLWSRPEGVMAPRRGRGCTGGPRRGAEGRWVGRGWGPGNVGGRRGGRACGEGGAGAGPGEEFGDPRVWGAADRATPRLGARGVLEESAGKRG